MDYTERTRVWAAATAHFAAQRVVECGQWDALAAHASARALALASRV